MSARETAIAALADLLRQTGAEVWRGTDVSRPVPADGLIMVAEGNSSETALLSPLAWEIDLEAEVTVTVTAADEPTRDAAMGALLAAIGGLIAADRSIGGAVLWAEPGAPQFEPAEIDGAGKSARFPVVLSFTASPTVLS